MSKPIWVDFTSKTSGKRKRVRAVDIIRVYESANGATLVLANNYQELSELIVAESFDEVGLRIDNAYNNAGVTT